MCSCSGNCNCNSATIPRGPQGIPGPQGDDGNAATISVGSVNTGSPAAVTNSGTQNAAIFDFIIPQGDPGSVWYNGAVAPTTLYNDGDYYINTSNGYYYEQQSGAWVFIGNLTGPPGPSTGTIHFSYINPSAINTITNVPFTVFNEQFASDTLCPNDGDKARIVGSLCLRSTTGGVGFQGRSFDLDFYLGASGFSTVILPRQSSTSTIDNSYQIKSIVLDNALDFAFINYTITIYRITQTTSRITLNYNVTYPKGSKSNNYMSIENSIGNLNFTTGSFAEFKIAGYHYQPPASVIPSTFTIPATFAEFTVEKITT